MRDRRPDSSGAVTLVAKVVGESPARVLGLLDRTGQEVLRLTAQSRPALVEYLAHRGSGNLLRCPFWRIGKL